MLVDIIATLKKIHPDRSESICASCSILTDLDLDSLRMLELISHLKSSFDFDVTVPPNSLSDLKSPETIVAAILGGRNNLPKANFST
jgi:acyl carrier protein